MAKAKSKIVLGTVQAIPFNKLVLSQSNVRRIAAGVRSSSSPTTSRAARIAAEPQRAARSRP